MILILFKTSSEHEIVQNWGLIKTYLQKPPAREQENVRRSHLSPKDLQQK